MPHIVMHLIVSWDYSFLIISEKCMVIQFSFRIQIALVKICFSRLVPSRAKISLHLEAPSFRPKLLMRKRNVLACDVGVCVCVFHGH